ncbi:hypothetical protein CERSUDRAFT_110184, partial [Gelatoporia subvermispora B]
NAIVQPDCSLRPRLLPHVLGSAAQAPAYPVEPSAHVLRPAVTGPSRRVWCTTARRSRADPTYGSVWAQQTPRKGLAGEHASDDFTIWARLLWVAPPRWSVTEAGASGGTVNTAQE